jgi:5-methylcytosine-specific restriction endonuclease McrA
VETSLNAARLTYEQRAAIELACTQKLAEFLQRRGLAAWDYRLIESDPAPDDVGYRVLAAATGRCSLCGATSADRRIEVDRIVPRSRGGSNDISNLQPLSDQCNRGKSNSTDERQRKVADALGDLARAELQDTKKPATGRSASGTDLARKAAKGQ